MAELFDSLPTAPVLRTFVLYLIAFCNQPKAASDVISDRFVVPTVPDKRAIFREHRLNHSREIPPAAVGGGKWTVFPLLLPTGSR